LTTGAVVSTVNVIDALPTLPTTSVAVTVTVWLPWVSAEVVKPELQLVALPPSVAHVVVVELASATPKLITGVVDAMTAVAAGELIVTTGATVSTVKTTACVAMFPAASVALTDAVRDPDASTGVT
jgi:hypothetical protein